MPYSSSSSFFLEEAIIETIAITTAIPPPTARGTTGKRSPVNGTCAAKNVNNSILSSNSSDCTAVQPVIIQNAGHAPDIAFLSMA